MDPLHNNLSTNSTTYDPNIEFFLTDSIRTLKFFCFGVAGILILSIGFIGNSLSIVIQLSKQMRSSQFSWYILILAIFDLLLGITYRGMVSLVNVLRFSGVKNYRKIYLLFPVLQGVNTIAYFVSLYITVLIAGQRYAILKWPLNISGHDNLSKARFKTTIIIIFSILIGLPTFFVVEIVCIPSPSTGIDLYIMTTPAWYLQTVWYYLYLAIQGFTEAFAILAMAVLNFLVYLEFKNNQNNRRKLLPSADEKHSPTAMLLATVLVSFVCTIPSFTYVTYTNLGGEGLLELYQSNIILLEINCSINFFIYCLWGKRFRKTFVHLFCKYAIFCNRQSTVHVIAKYSK